ncbi:MAG: hypothetical protein ACR2O6_04085 [Ilumatobacteraceae bacterium]
MSVALVVALVALAVYGVHRLWRRDRPLALLVIAPLAASWILMSGFTNTAFVLDGRYAIINFTFVVIAVAVGVDALLPRLAGMAQLAVAAWVAVFSVPLLVHDTGTDFHDPNQSVEEVVELLDERGIERVSGTYWWVLPVELLSDQRIRASVAGFPETVLLPLTQRLVEASPPEDVAFVFWRQGDDQSRLRLPIERYERIELAEVIVYIPTPA